MISREEWFHAIHSRAYNRIADHAKDCSGMRDNYGNTGLMCAVLGNDPCMVQLLAAYEAGLVSITGRTALYMAIVAENAELCYILAHYEQHILTEQNRTMLMVAVETGNTEIVAVLLPYFGNERDVAGFSALDLAVLKQDVSLVQLLLNAQNPNEHDISIALSIAKDNSYTNVIHILERHMRNSLTELCNNCKVLASKITVHTGLLNFLDKLLNTFYQNQKLAQGASLSHASPSPSVLETANQQTTFQGIPSGHTQNTYRSSGLPPRQEPSLSLHHSFMTTVQPTTQYEDSIRASSSLTRPTQANTALKLYYQPSIGPLANNYAKFQELNANFQLLNAEYNQLKERQNSRSKSVAAQSVTNSNVFSRKEKRVMGGNDESSYNDSSIVDVYPSTPGNTRRKSMNRISSKSSKSFGKRYMELDNTPSWPNALEKNETPLKASPLRRTPSQQHRLNYRDDKQDMELPITPADHWHGAISDLKEDVDYVSRLSDVQPSDDEFDSATYPITNAYRETNLMKAARENNLVNARRFLSTEAKACLPDGTTALMVAARFNSRELAHLLSSEEIRMQDSEGRTALHHAAENDSVDVFKVLYYQEKDLRTNLGLTAENLAKRNNAVNILAYLTELKEDQTKQYASYNKYEHTEVVAQNSVEFKHIDNKPVQKSKQIQDIINFYKAEQAASQKTNSEQSKSSTTFKNTKDEGIPPSVSLSVYDAPPSPNTRKASIDRPEPIHPIIIPAQPKQILEETPAIVEYAALTELEATTDIPNPISSQRPLYKRTSSTLALTGDNTNMLHNRHNNDKDEQNLCALPHHQPVRVGSNLKLRSASAVPEKANLADHPDEILAAQKKADGLTKERTKAPRRSRANSANVKSHSPLASGKSELMICVENDELETGKNLIEQQHGRGDRNGCTALMYAAKLNRANFATLLVKYEAGLVNDDDQTAYEIAMSHSNYAVAGIIRPYEKHLQKGSPERKLSLKMTDRGTPSCPGLIDESDSIFHGIPLSGNSSINDETPRTHQKLNRHTSSTQDLTVEMLFTNPTQQQSTRYTDTSPCTISPTDSPIMKPHSTTNSTPLIDAVKCGDLSGVKKHLHDHSGFSDDLGMTALMYAAEIGNYDMVMVLRATEAKRRIPNYPLKSFYELNNATSLMIAAAKGNSSCVKALVPYEGGLADNEGHTALMIAARYAYTDMISDLIPKEAKRLDINGQTALMIAVQNNLGKSHIEAIKLLREAELKCVDSSGVTALIWAAFAGQIEAATLLIEEAGMTTNKSHANGAGFTAIMAAAYAGSMPIVELLLPMEGNIVQANGKTVKDWAKSKKLSDMLDMIL